MTSCTVAELLRESGLCHVRIWRDTYAFPARSFSGTSSVKALKGYVRFSVYDSLPWMWTTQCIDTQPGDRGVHLGEQLGCRVYSWEAHPRTWS